MNVIETVVATAIILDTTIATAIVVVVVVTSIHSRQQRHSGKTKQSWCFFGQFVFVFLDKTGGTVDNRTRVVMDAKHGITFLGSCGREATSDCGGCLGSIGRLQFRTLVWTLVRVFLLQFIHQQCFVQTGCKLFVGPFGESAFVVQHGEDAWWWKVEEVIMRSDTQYARRLNRVVVRVDLLLSQ